MPPAFRELDGNDAYEVLGVPPDASSDRIQRAWRKLATAHHPDRVTDPAGKAEAEERLRLINAARDVLLERRASYDAARRAPEPDEEVIEDAWDTAAATSTAQPDPWDTATAGAHRPNPWTTTAPGPPPPPPRVRHIHHYHPPVPPRRSKLGIGCAVFTFACWALVIGTAVVMALRPDGPTAEAAVPANLAGTWEGTVKDHYGDHATWAVELTLEEGQNVGEVRYLHGRCVGKAVPVSYSGKSLRIRTDFPDEKSGCDVGDLTLTKRKDGKADIVYYASNQKTKRTTGTLRHGSNRP